MATADLDALRASIGTVTAASTTVLQRSLDASTSWVRDHVMDCRFDDPEVQEAIILMASRLYKRRQSPEGVAGFGELGVIRIISRDPDIELLLGHKWDMLKAGVA
jgi:hypothetical protein